MNVRPLDATEIATIRGQIALGTPATQIAHQMRVPLQMVEAYVSANLMPKSVSELQAARENTARIKAERIRRINAGPPPTQPAMRDLLRAPSIPKRTEIDIRSNTIVRKR